MVLYEGIFFDIETSKLICELEQKKLDKRNDLIHCTFKYPPSEEELFEDIIGLDFDLFIVGYGCDGHNSGFEVKLSNELIKYYINYHAENPTKLKTPHITTSPSNEY